MFKWIWNEKLNCYCAAHNSTIRADKDGDVFGGGGTTIQSSGSSQATPTPEEQAMQQMQEKGGTGMGSGKDQNPIAKMGQQSGMRIADNSGKLPTI